jgi:acetyl esterase/lipase
LRRPSLLIIVVMSKTTFLLAALFIGTAMQAGPQQNQPPAPSNPPPAVYPEKTNEVSIQQDVEYGSPGGQKLLLDIYQPTESSAKPRPAIILIHGGGWSSFDKGTMRSMGNLLGRSGFVAVSVDYRLFNGNENHWPTQLDDVQRAVRWLRANAAKYNIDASHLGAFGHSAGAQLAALLGMEDTRDNADPDLAKYSSRVQAVVDVSGPTDFLTSHDPDGALAGFFGGDHTKLPDVWRAASPVAHVAKSNAPFLIAHGTNDQMVPMAQAQELYDKLQQAGVPVKFVKVEDVHTFKTPEARRLLASETLQFFGHYLANNP